MFLDSKECLDCRLTQLLMVCLSETTKRSNVGQGVRKTTKILQTLFVNGPLEEPCELTAVRGADYDDDDADAFSPRGKVSTGNRHPPVQKCSETMNI